MKKLIGVCTHDFKKGVRIGKMHLAFAGEGLPFCGRRGLGVETGSYLDQKWISNNLTEVCTACVSASTRGRR